MTEGAPPRRFRVEECGCGVPAQVCDTFDLAPEREVLLFRQCGGASNCGFFEWMQAPRDGNAVPVPVATAGESQRNVRQKRDLDAVEDDDDPNPATQYEYVMKRKADHTAASLW
jgi:hypothetical protein